ncbi:MAG: hypothetical protein EOP06_18775, partial [Proteobacteria bacterium]
MRVVFSAKAMVWALFAYGISMNAHAAPPAYCVDKYEIFDNTQVQISPTGDSCTVSVHPREAYVDLIYRDFLFDTNGLFMVFNSYGNGSDSQSTSAREFYFFPRAVSDLKYEFDAKNNRLMVTAASGKRFYFNTIKAILTDVSGSMLQQDYSMEPKNRGGVEFPQNDGLIMDGGFKIGQSPSQYPKEKVTFRDPTGNTCDLTNSEVYKYLPSSDA